MASTDEAAAATVSQGRPAGHHSPAVSSAAVPTASGMPTGLSAANTASPAVQTNCPAVDQ
ncbi:hypothetical protein [Amycolatopsis nigrescens]|uniref:hypothetical protein n=1 Tax=Amycolatopsis nigrescens TaxID=381445 RepID=UPI00039CEA2D|nr:hypothetical protein [Amycolatopsis nigrescens]